MDLMVEVAVTEPEVAVLVVVFPSTAVCVQFAHFLQLVNTAETRNKIPSDNLAIFMFNICCRILCPYKTTKVLCHLGSIVWLFYFN